MMVVPVYNSGESIDAEYAARRSYFEMLIEMMQIKGNTEVHPSFWPNDEFAGFENAYRAQTYNIRTLTKEHFVRYTLTQGVAYQAALGEKPWKRGIGGGTDSHDGSPAM